MKKLDNVIELLESFLEDDANNWTATAHRLKTFYALKGVIQELKEVEL